MKTVAIVVLLLALAPVPDALAHEHHHHRLCFGSRSCDAPTRFAPRHDVAAAHLAITTEDGAANLVLTRRVVAVQLSDRTMHRLDRELRDEQEKDEGFLAEVIKDVVLGSVRSALNHSFECPLRSVREAEYRDGHLVLTTNHGGRLFEGLDVNDHEVLDGFSESDARAFVREFDRLMSRGV